MRRRAATRQRTGRTVSSVGACGHLPRREVEATVQLELQPAGACARADPVGAIDEAEGRADRDIGHLRLQLQVGVARSDIKECDATIGRRKYRVVAALLLILVGELEK